MIEDKTTNAEMPKEKVKEVVTEIANTTKDMAKTAKPATDAEMSKASENETDTELSKTVTKDVVKAATPFVLQQQQEIIDLSESPFPTATSPLAQTPIPLAQTPIPLTQKSCDSTSSSSRSGSDDDEDITKETVLIQSDESDDAEDAEDAENAKDAEDAEDAEDTEDADNADNADNAEDAEDAENAKDAEDAEENAEENNTESDDSDIDPNYVAPPRKKKRTLTSRGKNQPPVEPSRRKQPRRNCNQKKKTKNGPAKATSQPEQEEQTGEASGLVNWAEGLCVTSQQILTETILGSPSDDPVMGKGTARPTKNQLRHDFLNRVELDVETLKARAKTCELSIHKTVNVRDEVCFTHSPTHSPPPPTHPPTHSLTQNGNKVAKKLFFYPRACKGTRSKNTIVRFTLRKSGEYTLVGDVSDVLKNWNKVSPVEGEAQLKRRPIQYTREAVKTVISMLDGSKSQMTYNQIADRLNDPNAASAYKVNAV